MSAEIVTGIDASRAVVVARNKSPPAVRPRVNRALVTPCQWLACTRRTTGTEASVGDARSSERHVGRSVGGWVTKAMTRLSREHSSEHDAIALAIRAGGHRGVSAAGIGYAITRPKRLSMPDTEAIGLAAGCSLMR